MNSPGGSAPVPGSRGGLDLTELRRTLTANDFDVERHASQLIQSGTDIGKYLQELAEAEQQVDQMLQDQVLIGTAGLVLPDICKAF